MSQLYKINLTPAGTFFFGQEVIAELGNRQSYFRRSALFPQQSTLLGMLRHQLLLQHGMAIPRVAEPENPAQYARELIGPRGFDPKIEQQSFGKIRQLGPVFLQRNQSGQYFLRDHEWIDHKDFDHAPELFQLKPGDPQASWVLGDGASEMIGLKIAETANGTVKMLDYTAKEEFKGCLHDPGDPHSAPIPLGTVFHEASAVGVYKFVSRKLQLGDNEQGYYKNVYQHLGEQERIVSRFPEYQEPKLHRRKLDSAWSFAFYVEMADDSTLEESDSRAVLMGKERSTFLIQIRKADAAPDYGGISAPHEGLQKVLLLSDACLEESSLQLASSLVVGNTVRFRSFTKPYRSEDRKWKANLGKDQRSASYCLLKRGSIIYTNKVAQIETTLQAKINWQNIGYNNYTILTA